MEQLTTPPDSRMRIGGRPRRLVTTIRFVRRCVAARSNLYLALAVGLYIFLVGVLLLSSKFLPYVTDNNESFSMFIHAQNMLKFGLSHAAGLSDESYAIDPAGHPYVYTHEGNFPRVPVYFLMLLGVTKIEWQIALHALVLGAATVYLCFRFFSRIGGPLLALVVCTVFSTDYLLFMQWEVNTFRVWHGFFFFLSLVCVQSIGDLGRRKAEPLLFLTFVALFYFEVVFAVFVLATCMTYALFTSWQGRLVLRVAVIGIAGMAVALCGLLGQSVAYLGWPVAWQDVQLTLINRNFHAQTVGRLGDSLGFFLKHHIVYWLDTPDTRGYLNLAHFLGIVGGAIFLAYTPYLILMTWALTAPWAVRMGLRKGALTRRQDRSSSRDGVPRNAFPGLNLFCVINGGLALSMIAYAAVIFVLDFLVLDLRGVLRPAAPDAGRILQDVFAIPEGARRVLPPLWLDAIQGYFGDRMLQAGLIGCIVLAWMVIVSKGGRRYLRPQNARFFTGALWYLIAGGVALACVYILFPGYMRVGYLDRYAPLPVFVVDVWIALFFWMLIIVARASGREVIAKVARSVFRERGGKALSVTTPLFVFALSLSVLILGSVYWLRIQTVYANALPPTNLSILRELGQGMYRGSTFISNEYAAPIAYYTGNWAYMDAVVSDNRDTFRLGRTQQLIGGEFLWEADRESNSDYLHPQYYICIAAPSLDMAARVIALHGRGRLSNCSSQPLVRDAENRIGPFMNVLEASDPSPRDMWAIVKLDPSIEFVRWH